MAIRFACDACGRAYEQPEAAIGRQAKCECGEMLVVPAKSTLVIPPPVPPVPASKPSPAKKEERPPRTLHQAAEVARKKREAEELNEAKLAAMAAEASSPAATDPLEASDRPADAVGPPPLPPTASVRPPRVELSGEPPALPPQNASVPASTRVVKYRNLRAYCGYIKTLAFVIAILAFVGALVQAIIALVQVAQTGDPIVAAGGAFAVVVTLLIGFGWYVLLRAIAEFFHVLMDIEENTRRTP